MKRVSVSLRESLGVKRFAADEAGPVSERPRRRRDCPPNQLPDMPGGDLICGLISTPPAKLLPGGQVSRWESAAPNHHSTPQGHPAVARLLVTQLLVQLLQPLHHRAPPPLPDLSAVHLCRARQRGSSSTSGP